MPAALRSAVLREDPYGPFGGLPEKVRVDRGKDFLSRTVTAAFGLLDVTVEDLPAYTPHLKGTVEGLNRAVESMFLTALPGYGTLSVAGLRRCVHAALAIRYRLDWRGGAFGGAADDGRLDVGDAQVGQVAGGGSRLSPRGRPPFTTTHVDSPGRVPSRPGLLAYRSRGHRGAGRRRGRGRCGVAPLTGSVAGDADFHHHTHHDAAGGLFTGSEGRVVGGD
ncbi:hypothetical protein [Streptomyces mirabilis]|uniref:hypothetical protein n=1 Tax=Streptomyces mirabilis TaxID=68239 RepID=UPI00365789A6